MKERSALLVGATGLIGGYCLDELLKDMAYHQVTILVRKAVSIENPKLIKHIIDFDKLENYANLIQADDIYCCLGTTIKVAGSQKAFRKVDFDYSCQIARIASANQSKQFLIVTAVDSNAKSRIFYNRVKGDVEQVVSKLAFSSLSIFRPSLLLGKRQGVRPGEKIGEFLAKSVNFLLVGRLRKYRPIDAKVVAHAMVQTAKEEMQGIQVLESDQIKKRILEKEKGADSFDNK